MNRHLWTHRRTAAELVTPATRKKSYHEERLTFWKTEEAAALTAHEEAMHAMHVASSERDAPPAGEGMVSDGFADTSSFSPSSYANTSAYFSQYQAVVNAEQSRLTQARQKHAEHKSALELYERFLRAFAYEPAKVYKLDLDDLSFFGL